MNEIRNIPDCKFVIKICIVLLFCALLSVLFVDNRVFLAVNKYVYNGQFHVAALENRIYFYDALTSESLLLAVAGLFTILCYATCMSKISWHRLSLFAVYQIVCVVVINHIKLLLKYLFARCVPTLCNKFAAVGIVDFYGFKWFTIGFDSFPSGHCIIFSYFIVWLLFYKRQLLFIAFQAFAILFVGLIVLNYHFVGDCIAGLCIGGVLGYISIVLWIKIILRIDV